MVIVSHSPQLVDGNTSREVMNRFFGTGGLGGDGVVGFFLVSGYLITKSFSERPHILSYAIKRVARIFPAYLICFLLCTFALAPFVGARQSVLMPSQIWSDVFLISFLSGPMVPGAFHGLPYPVLNGSIWTIAYEFRCYIAVPVIGGVWRLLRLGMFQLRWVLLVLVLAGLVVDAAGYTSNADTIWTIMIGRPWDNLNFCSVFGVGALFYLFRDRIVLDNYGALAAGCLLFVTLFNRHAAISGLAVLGGYLLFWFALKFKCLEVSMVAGRNDISYGLYLYAWPIQNMVIWLDRTINPWVLSLITLALAGLAGYVSWHLVEKRVLAFAQRLHFSSTRQNI